MASHYELGPYLLATGTAAYAAGVSSIKPVAAPPVDFPFALEVGSRTACQQVCREMRLLMQPDLVPTYAYQLGANIFVSPVVDSNVTRWNVTVPSGSDTW